MSIGGTGPGRRPPKKVRDALCREVGFRCPIRDCGSPYLTFHHFRPPWSVKPHHNPAGMIALCSNHAAKADGGYYPDDYLLELKDKSATAPRPVVGEFDYLTRDLVVVVGSMAFYDVDTIVEIDGERCVYFNRDESGFLLLNFKMPSMDGGPRAWMEDNVWTVYPGARNVECPPRGRFLKVEFDNGDGFDIDFRVACAPEEFESIVPGRRALAEAVKFPVTVARISERSRNGLIEFGHDEMRLPQGNRIIGGAVIGASVGISLSGYGVLKAETFRAVSSALDAYNNGRRR